MDPLPTTSRFVRGRGGRPYFYFRRNGKTIPGGNTENHRIRSFSSRGKRRGWFSNVGQTNSSGLLPPAADSRSLRSALYAAPEDDADSIQSIAVETFPSCPGWRLYFYKEKYEESSSTTARIKILEKHFLNFDKNYDFMKIYTQKFFLLDANVVKKDQTVIDIWPSLMEDIRNHPLRTLAIFGSAMYSVVCGAINNASINLQPDNGRKYTRRTLEPRKIYARPINFVCPSSFAEISTESVDNLLSLRGVVVSIGNLDASASWICYKCSRCSQEQAMRQSGNFACRPYACKRGECHARKGFVEKRSSRFTRIRPVQIIRIAEVNFEATELQEQNSINVQLCHDLVDSLYPGQDVVLTGVLKIVPLKESEGSFSKISSTSISSEIYLKAVSLMDVTNNHTEFTERDINAISAIINEPDCLKLLVHSIAPEVCGNEIVKAGILLSLAGGSGSQLHNECDINVLLVGDPGTGKSHMLQMSTAVSEKVNFINGKKGKSSTAIYSTIQGRSQSSLDLGAIISAGNKHVVIDDLDQLGVQQDIFHQIIQCQCATLSFNGVFVSQKVCSPIIASANPQRGHYDRSKVLTENTRISPALSCHFHLVFVLSDKPNKEMDTLLTEHIQKLHAGAKKSTAIADRYALKPKTNNSFNTTSLQDDEEDDNEDYGFADRLKLTALEENNMELLPSILIKKYLVCAQQKVNPLLTVEASQKLKKFYEALRAENNDDKSLNLSSSHLVGLIKLSQARARIDFSAEVTRAHVRDVICLVRQSMCDVAVGDYVDLEQTFSKTSRTTNMKKFLKILQMRSSSLNKRIFDMDELKDMARQVGISSDICSIIDAVNLQGYLLKKGSSIYEVMDS